MRLYDLSGIGAGRDAMTIRKNGKVLQALACAALAALAAVPAAAQTAADGAVATAGPGFRLRGLPEPAEDAFADGGIEEANKAPERASILPVPKPAPRLAEDLQGRVAREPRVTGGQQDPAEALDDPAGNPAVAPVEPGVRPSADTDPFAPGGLRLGSWRASLKAEQSLGYSTNTARAAGGESGAVSRSSGSLSLRSDWSRHEASIEANGAYERALGEDTQGIPTADLAAGLRLDLVDGVTANLRGVYRYTTESTTSDLLTGPVAERPGVHAFGASAEIGRSGMRLGSSLKASADRTVYEDAALSGGGLLDQGDRNNTLYQLTGRASYEISPALTPFLQAGIGRRVHDTDVDRNGDDRDSTVYDLRAGVALDLGEKLKGEVALGYLAEDYDGSLETLGAPSVNASLDWSPVRDTQVRLSAATSLNGSTTAGDNGSLVRSFRIEVDRQLNDRISLSAKAGLDMESDAAGGDADLTWSAGAGITYWINRFLGVKAAVDHERLDSASAGRSFDATAVTLGVTLQR